MVHLCPPSALLSLHTVCTLIFSVADPDQGSGAFLTLDPDPGSATAPARAADADHPCKLTSLNNLWWGTPSLHAKESKTPIRANIPSCQRPGARIPGGGGSLPPQQAWWDALPAPAICNHFTIIHYSWNHSCCSHLTVVSSFVSTIGTEDIR